MLLLAGYSNRLVAQQKPQTMGDDDRARTLGDFPERDYWLKKFSS